MSVGINASLHMISSFFSYRELDHNALTGTIPPQISTLTKLTWLCVPKLNQFTKCWSYTLLSVGLARLFLSLSRWIWCYFRSLSNNRLEGTIPDAISTLVKLTGLCALTSFYSVLALCASLSHFPRGLLFFFTGASSPTDWLGQSQHRYLRWSSCKNCVASLLFS